MRVSFKYLTYNKNLNADTEYPCALERSICDMWFSSKKIVVNEGSLYVLYISETLLLFYVNQKKQAMKNLVCGRN